jgi:hypothetical protein
MRISELPQEIKELALLRQTECVDPDYQKRTDFLENAFEWDDTEEGEKYWNDWDDKETIKEKPKNYDDVITIIENKIATMSSRGFESYYLPIGILKDLIREIKEIK